MYSMHLQNDIYLLVEMYTSVGHEDTTNIYMNMQHRSHKNNWLSTVLINWNLNSKCLFVFKNFCSTNNQADMESGPQLKSHPQDRCSKRLNLQSLIHNTSELSTIPQPLQCQFLLSANLSLSSYFNLITFICWWREKKNNCIRHYFPALQHFVKYLVSLSGVY